MISASKRQTKNKPRDQRGNGAIAEFGAVFVAIVLLVILPLITLIIIGAGVALTYAYSSIASAKAARATTFSNALSSIEQVEQTMKSTHWLELARFKPTGGFKDGGLDLQVIAIDQKTNEISLSPVDRPWQGRTDLDRKVYEYELATSIEVGPYWDGCGSTFVKNLPVIGKSARVSFTLRRFIEHPEGICN